MARTALKSEDEHDVIFSAKQEGKQEDVVVKGEEQEAKDEKGGKEEQDESTNENDESKDHGNLTPAKWKATTTIDGSYVKKEKKEEKKKNPTK